VRYLRSYLGYSITYATIYDTILQPKIGLVKFLVMCYAK